MRTTTRPCVPLCLDEADARGWIREGAPAVPLQMWSGATAGLQGPLSGRERNANAGPTPFEPAALPDDPRDAVEAGIELFNESGHRAHRVGDHPHARRSPRERGSAQPPRGRRHDRLGAVVVPVSGRHAGPQPVTLQHRGAGAGRDRDRFQAWNAAGRARRLRRPGELAVSCRRCRTRRCGGTCRARVRRRRSRVTRRSSVTSPGLAAAAIVRDRRSGGRRSPRTSGLSR